MGLQILYFFIITIFVVIIMISFIVFLNLSKNYVSFEKRNEHFYFVVVIIVCKCALKIFF